MLDDGCWLGCMICLLWKRVAGCLEVRLVGDAAGVKAYPSGFLHCYIDHELFDEAMTLHSS